MSARNRHAVHQSRDISFSTEFGDVTLHADTFVEKSRLYSLKRRILAGRLNLEMGLYRHFILKENGDIHPITDKWALRNATTQGVIAAISLRT